MAQNNQDWDDLGKNLEEIIDRAVNSQDFQRMEQTIRQVVERAVDIGGQAVRKVVTNAAAPVTPTPVYRTRAVRRLYAGTGGKTLGGICKAVGGGFLTFISSMAMLGGLITAEMTLGLGIFTLGLFGSGVALLGSGIGTFRMLDRYAAYRRTLGQNTHCSIERLARSVGKSPDYVRKDLWKMIGNGLFLEGHMDREETCLLTSHETYRYYEQSRLQLEARQQMEAREKKLTASVQPPKKDDETDPQLREVLEKGRAFIAQIRKCNDDIPGVEISEKISRMELLVQRIFHRAEEHPEIVPDLKKLMNYYLPMTVKLLNAYADMDAQPIQGENIQSSKREIEATLDTLNLAYEKLLDSVFKDTALDVSSDISVLNTLLAQEGLTQDDFSQKN